MEKKKRLADRIRKASKAIANANEALNEVMQELDLETLDMVTGAGDLFKDRPRSPTEEYGDDREGY